MNREVHVRFCERFRGENPLYLLDAMFLNRVIYIVSFKNSGEFGPVPTYVSPFFKKLIFLEHTLFKRR